MYDIYTLEKMQEYRQAETERMDRKGMYVQPDPAETRASSERVTLKEKFYRLFRRGRSQMGNKSI